MNDKRLLEERIYPALTEMYQKAETVFPKEELPADFEITFENLCKYAPFSNENKTERQFPLDMFYLADEEVNTITKKATHHLKKYFVFPYRSEMIYSDEEIAEFKERVEKMKAESTIENEWLIEDLEEKIKYNDENRRREQLWQDYRKEYEAIVDKDKEMSKGEKKKALSALYKKYGCVERSRDAEAVRWTLFDYEPNSNREFFEAVKAKYEGRDDVQYRNNERVEHVAKLAKDFVNNIKNNTPTWRER